jgi:hypothetical protein
MANFEGESTGLLVKTLAYKNERKLTGVLCRVVLYATNSPALYPADHFGNISRCNRLTGFQENQVVLYAF